MPWAQANSRGDVSEFAVNTAILDALPANFTGARVYRITAQNISNSTWTAIQFDNESYDTDGFHDNVTNNTRLTIPALALNPGGWRISGGVVWTANAVGGRGVQVFVNGSAIPAVVGDTQKTCSLAFQTSLAMIGFVGNLFAGDYIEMKVSQNSGGILSVVSCSFAISMIKK